MPLDLLGAVVGWVSADLGSGVIRGAERLLLGPPQRRALRAVLIGAVGRTVAAAGLPEDRAAHLRAVLLERRVVDDRLLVEDRTDVGAVIGGWMTELDHSELSVDGYLAEVGVSVEWLTDTLVEQLWIGLRADARGGGPLGPLVEALWRDHLTARLELLVDRLPTAPTRTVGGLPAVPQLMGRADDLDRLLRATGRVVAIDGMAGVGKTAFAVYAADVLASSYPDGAIFIDLHGYTDGVAPLDPAAALGQLMRDAGVHAGEVPADLAARSARWRSAMADRRSIVVFDNVHSSTQVRPLLPSARHGLVLITSRRRLIGLPEAHPMSLEVLPPVDATALFVALSGQRDQAVDRVAALCGGLPLALAVAAARLRHDPFLTPAQLADMLAKEHARLAELSPEDAGVQAAFTSSLWHLDKRMSSLFAVLGLHPGPDLAAGPVGALAGVAREAAEQALRDLADQHLVERRGLDRYALHDLLRAYARQLPAGLDRSVALFRLVEHYRAVLRVSDSDTRLTAERDNLRELVRAHRTDAAASVGCAAAHRLRLLGFPDHARDLFRLGWTISTDSGNVALTADAALGLGMVSRFADEYDRARRWFSRAHAGYVATGNRRGEAQAIRGAAGVAANVGDFIAAGQHNTEALAIFTDIGDRQGIADATTGLAFTAGCTGDTATAWDRYQRAYQLYREIDDPFGAANALTGLAGLTGLDDPGGARPLFQQAFDLADASGNQLGRAQSLRGLAWLDAAEGHHTAATAGYQRALHIYTMLGDRLGEIQTLNELSDTEQTLGRPQAAEALHARALKLARAIGNPHAVAETLSRTSTDRNPDEPRDPRSCF